LASLQARNPFTESGPICLKIEASIPGLAKQGSLLAIRQPGSSELDEYIVQKLGGDSLVRQQVIARYLVAEKEAEKLSYSSVAITPSNYKFRYVGSIGGEGNSVYVFQIVPKKKHQGLIRGEIWIDSATGFAVRQVGRFVKRPSFFIRQMDVTRDIILHAGFPTSRVTHLVIQTRLVGRVELTITETPVEQTNP
jgi:hypothetical protein